TFSVPFEVSGLPDLRVTGAELLDQSSLKTGDAASVEVEVSNVGSEPAAASVLGVALNGVAMDGLAVVALDAGASTNVTVNFSAPPTGEYVLRFTPDAEDAVVESQEENQDYDFAFTVHPRMDLRHKGAPSVTVVDGALNGPWTVSGEIERFDGDGTVEVPMRLEVPNDNGGNLMLGSFSVTVAGQGYATATWQTTIDSDDVVGLQRISREVVAVIDPFGTASFVQESTTNDRSPAGNLDLLPIPDVQLDPPIANPSEPESGEAVQWSVFIQNVGEIPVRGTLEYSFEGIEYEDRIFLDAAEGKFWSPENPLPTALGEHTAEFTARYVPDADSWDYNPDNSRATVSVEVQAPLRLEWNTPTLELVDANQAPAAAPLTPGQMYTMSIGVTSIETGPVNYTCDDGAGNVFETIPVVIETRGQRATVSCTFEAQTGQTAVRLVPDDVDVSSVFTRAYASAAVQDDSITDEQRSLRGLLSWAGLLVLILIGVLVLGVIITRDRDKEVERDIFEYCPS
ncbi:MAG: CARDB domain-containing protein, partial [Candidatus Thermoplasmatota archaeon]|nr:CARDB domain-containing protein [Candidatus Thermoplasmatota archaeon]